MQRIYLLRALIGKRYKEAITLASKLPRVTLKANGRVHPDKVLVMVLMPRIIDTMIFMVPIDCTTQTSEGMHNLHGGNNFKILLGILDHVPYSTSNCILIEYI